MSAQIDEPPISADTNLIGRLGRRDRSASGPGRTVRCMSIAITEDHRALADTVSDFLTKHESRRRRPRPPRGAGRVEPRLLRRSGRSRLARPARARGVRRIGLRRSRSSSSSSRSSAAASLPGRSCRPSSPALSSPPPAPTSRRPPGCPASPTGRSTARSAIGGSAELRDGTLARIGRGGHRCRARPRDPRARSATTSPSSTSQRRRDGRDAAEPRSDPPRRPGHLRRRPRRDRRRSDGQALIDLARTIFSAEATGIARECTEQAAEYAKEREQFGRPIAMFQAVKHHCANMLVATELSTAAVWDAARAAAAGGDQFSLHRGDGGHARASRRRPVRPAQHPGARRHRLHVGARRAPLSPPGVRPRGGHRPGVGGDRHDRPHPRRCPTCPLGRPARPRPRRSATSCRPSSPRPRASRAPHSATG